MEVDHKDMIDKNYMLFTELLRLKSRDMIRYLYDEQTLTEKNASRAMSHALPSSRTMHFLDNLLTMAAEEFKTLYAAILYTKLWRAADILEPRKRQHEDIYDAPPIPLPDVWPDEAYFEELENKELEIKKVESDDIYMLEWYEESKKNNIYDMRKKIKGRALIINNYKFKHHKLYDRVGSEKDVKGLENIFRRLGFEPESHKDLMGDEMNELLKKECKKDHTNYDGFFLIIMSHGHKGVVYGTDGYRREGQYYNCLKIEDIKKDFVNVKSLERKPKVFIIQACQGSYNDRGIRLKDFREDQDEEAAAIDSAHPAENQDNEDDEEDRYSDEEVDDAEEREREALRELNKELDDGITAEAPFHFLVAIATTEGYYAHRHPKYGAWFTQAFIYVLAKYAWKEDLLTLMEKVNDLVRKAKTPTDPKTSKHSHQVSQITNTFIKKFYFFPGMPLDTPIPKKQPIPYPPPQLLAKKT